MAKKNFSLLQPWETHGPVAPGLVLAAAALSKATQLPLHVLQGFPCSCSMLMQLGAHCAYAIS